MSIDIHEQYKKLAEKQHQHHMLSQKGKIGYVDTKLNQIHTSSTRPSLLHQITTSNNRCLYPSCAEPCIPLTNYCLARMSYF